MFFALSYDFLDISAAHFAMFDLKGRRQQLETKQEPGPQTEVQTGRQAKALRQTCKQAGNQTTDLGRSWARTNEKN